ncbi:hypothetical protein PRZ48_006095 [Zasmidium cellare]|uniref:Uncharacterized protein n=1 Tax=Zasmidium cellare TaxID=395010 RepID=A0ABR0EM33_ZASCE|nr:hypothetical protein PRZ48_006095 [Zasmidium cellare]
MPVSDRTVTHRYTLVEIDHLLSLLDETSEPSASSQKGPFTIFAARGNPQKHMSSHNSETLSPRHDGNSRDGSPQPDTVYGSTDDQGVQTTAIERNTALARQKDDTGCQFRLPSSSHYFDFEEQIANSTSDCHSYPKVTETLDEDFCSLQTPDSIPTHLKEDEDDFLMQYYVSNLADVLQPVNHPSSPYRGVYAPFALQGVSLDSCQSLYEPRPEKAVHHAILASAAFHLWNGDHVHRRFAKTAARHRWCAIRSLQATIALRSIQYRAVMMAVLTSITMGVVAGDDDNFLVHIQGIMQLRNTRKNWRMISESTRQLNDISSLLALLARTLAFEPASQLACIDPAEDDYSRKSPNMIYERREASCYAYIYGVTPQTVDAIRRTCRLAETIESLEKGSAIPSDVLESCETLGDDLLSWDLTSNHLDLFLGDREDAAIFEHHAKAWHHAALTYYYRRIQGLSYPDLVHDVRLVATHMQAVETLKAASSNPAKKAMAPIPWPMFIASCEALGEERYTFEEWWKSIQRYGIANNKRLWDAVQIIWRTRDQNQTERNEETTSWIDMYRDLGIRLLPV